MKDGIHHSVVNGQAEAASPQATGTKATACYPVTVPPGQAQVIRLRLNRTAEGATTCTPDYDEVLSLRRRGADEFYAGITPPGIGAEAAQVMRQALAGMLWSRQNYYYDVEVWLKETPENPQAAPQRFNPRNREWLHLFNADVISMPDTWEYPWYAAWDPAFHTVALAMVDRDFAHPQLDLMLRERHLHPNGQIPAYEWNFGDAHRFNSDPRWRDHLLYHEYFHGDNGAGLGASHQTGWTGVIAKLIQGLGAPADGGGTPPPRTATAPSTTPPTGCPPAV